MKQRIPTFEEYALNESIANELPDHNSGLLAEIERIKTKYPDFKYNHKFGGNGIYKNSWFAQIVKPNGETFSYRGPVRLRDVVIMFLLHTKDKTKDEVESYVDSIWKNEELLER